MAEPDAILIGARTHQLLGNRFEYESLGERALKGFASAVPVWRVLREASAETRFAATRARGRRAFVGRSKESSLLADLWQRACDGEGRAVVISGEAGMGKSRLADVLTDRFLDERCYRVTCQCSPYHTNSALHPVIRHLERAAGFAAGDSDAEKLDKLEAMLRTGGTVTTSGTSLLADLLSLPTSRYPPVELPPDQRKNAVLAALVDLLTGLARDAPVMLLLEDAHWIDPTTTELWTRLIDGIDASPMLALVTARPEFTSPWKDRSHASSLELSRLTPDEAAALVGATAAPRVLERALVDNIVAKSDGVPLYVEELTKAVLESSTPGEPAVPATLQDSLMARLDRLGPAKEIAQVAAVIGHHFSHELLTVLASQSALQLEGSMRGLLDAGLVYRRGQNGSSSYSFKHALVRDVAYNSLLRTRRQQLHGRIGEVVLRDFAFVAESEPELLAHHFHHAAVWEAACTWRERAGDRALAHSSYTESVAHYREALAEAAQIQDLSQRERRELALLLKLGPQITLVKGPQSPEAGDVYRRAREHAIALEDEPALFKATWGLWYHAAMDRMDRARDYSEELMTLGRKLNDDDLLLEAFHCRWGTGLLRGDMQMALDASREGTARYDRAKHAWMGAVFGGHDTGVCAHAQHATALALLGRCAESAQFRQRAMGLAETLAEAHNRAHALLWVTNAAQIASAYTELIHLCDASIALADKYGLLQAHTHGSFLRASAWALGDDLEVGVAAMEAEFARAAAVGPFMRFYAGVLADGQLRLGKVEAALEVVRRALATVSEPGVGFFVSELHRVQGLCLLHNNRTDEAMHSLHSALDIARAQQATVLEVRAAIGLARAGIALRRPGEGLGLLRELCASLPSAFDAPELREARELLSTQAPASWNG
jgi:tetratricopeptide (TPR) repeat protein